MRTHSSCHRFVGCAAAVSSLFTALALAQSNAEPKADAKSRPATSRAADSRPRQVVALKVHTDLVLIPVTGTLNRFDLRLQKDDLQLSEDGAQQSVTLFSAEDGRLSVGVIFDESGGMSTKLKTLRYGAT